jgi:leader peptidase (prepilin peptidase)/N-methyltransferase
MTAGELAWRAALAMAGPLIGGAAATLANAWPRRPTTRNWSRCSACGASIPPWRRIPLLSAALLGGRRPCCGGTIPRTYPVGEAIGLLAGLLAAAQPSAVAGGLLLLAGAILAYIALVDLRRFTIPLAGLISLAGVIGLDLLRAGSIFQAMQRLATGAVLALVLETLRRFSRRDGRAAMGSGDVMLAGLLGVLVGWRAAPLLLAFAALAPLLIQMISRRRGPTPFGFWLALFALPAFAWALQG